MVRQLVNRLVGRSSGAFVRAACARGVKLRVARALEPAADELFGPRPEEILTSRSAFERAAMHTVIGDAGNLELSFSLVDVLASTVETLGLARASDVPDPFRRVWIRNSAGARKRGVVLRCEMGEVAVFCPAGQERRLERRNKVQGQQPGSGRRFTDAGDIMKLSYRGFSSSVEYELRLNDAVRLPGALVLHLSRPDGEGAIGRDNRRVDVRLEGVVRAVGNFASGESDAPIPCRILDASSGGLRIASDIDFEKGREVELQVWLPDDGTEALSLTALIRWNRSDDTGQRTQGLQFAGLSPSATERYRRYLGSLLPAAGALESAPGAETGSLLAGQETLVGANERNLLQSREIEALRAQVSEHPSEVEQLAQRIAELQTQLEVATRRAAAHKSHAE